MVEVAGGGGGGDGDEVEAEVVGASGVVEDG